MGICWSKSYYKLIIIGFNNTGKTTILHKLSGNDSPPMPTIVLETATIEYKNNYFETWDVSGHRIGTSYYWYTVYPGVDGIIFVIDSSDINRMNTDTSSFASVKTELFALLHEKDLKNVPLLIYANKQDTNSALTVEQIKSRLELDKIQDRKWHIQGSYAPSGIGLFEGFEWLYDNVT